MSKRIFITATDTNAGKTYISAGLLRTAHNRQIKATGVKPVASGCVMQNGKLCNDDVMTLRLASPYPLDVEVMNPFTFEPAIAPHIAAAQSGIKLDVTTLLQQSRVALTAPVDVHIIEGFGGWHAPLNYHETMADYAVALNCNVVMVVGIRLGCINHAILTERAILASGASCLGWIANKIDPDMSYQIENIQTLQRCLHTPQLGTVGYRELAEFSLRDHAIF